MPSKLKRRRWFILLLIGVLTLLCLLASAWAFGALFFDGPFGFAPGRANLVLAGFWVFVVFAAVFIFTRGAGRRLLVWLFLFLAVLVPWLTIRPSNDRDWQPQWAVAGWSETEGDVLTIHGFRNFDYDLEGNTTERWESRSFRWSKLRGLDYFHEAWGGDFLAHPILSFDFGPDGHVCLSIETRREKGEEYSTLGGLYRMFELSYLVGAEEDFVRQRTNVAKNPIYLYRARYAAEEARARLEDSLAVLNRLRERPQFYNVLSGNCTTSLRAQTPAERRERFDLRMLANGRLDEYFHEIGLLDDEGLSFEELRPKAHINEAALEAHDDADFSAKIREGRPGFRK